MQSERSNSSGKGYLITACNSESGPFIRNALHVEMDTENWLYSDDDEAARAAQRDGVKLIYGVPFVADGIYLDTPENREIVEKYSRKIFAAIRRKKRDS